MIVQHPIDDPGIGIRHICVHLERMEITASVVMSILEARLQNESFHRDQRPYRWYTEKEAVIAISIEAPVEPPIPPDSHVEIGS